MSLHQGRLPGPAAAHAANHCGQERWPPDVPKAAEQIQMWLVLKIYCVTSHWKILWHSEWTLLNVSIEKTAEQIYGPEVLMFLLQDKRLYNKLYSSISIDYALGTQIHSVKAYR